MRQPAQSQERQYHPWTTHILAREEARSRGDRKIGTEHLVLGLLREPEVARALGCDLDSARDALAELDRDALAEVGLDSRLDAPPIPTDESGPPPRPTLRAVLRDRRPLTPAAKEALRSSRRAMRHNDRAGAQRDMLLALLELQPPDPAAALLARLGVDRAAARARLASQ